VEKATAVADATAGATEVKSDFLLEALKDAESGRWGAGGTSASDATLGEDGSDFSS